MKGFINAINSPLSMGKANVEWGEILRALEYVERQGVNFVDALTLQAMKKNKVTEIYSNDAGFVRIRWVKRVGVVAP